jgi:hypothetical protein
MLKKMNKKFFEKKIEPGLENQSAESVSLISPEPEPFQDIRDEFLQYKKKSEDRVESLEKVVSAQAEMLKEMNKKLEDFFKTKNGLKRQNPLNNKSGPAKKNKKII